MILGEDPKDGVLSGGTLIDGILELIGKELGSKPLREGGVSDKPLGKAALGMVNNDPRDGALKDGVFS